MNTTFIDFFFFLAFGSSVYIYIFFCLYPSLCTSHCCFIRPNERNARIGLSPCKGSVKGQHVPALKN